MISSIIRTKLPVYQGHVLRAASAAASSAFAAAQPVAPATSFSATSRRNFSSFSITHQAVKLGGEEQIRDTKKKSKQQQQKEEVVEEEEEAVDAAEEAEGEDSLEAEEADWQQVMQGEASSADELASAESGEVEFTYDWMSEKAQERRARSFATADQKFAVVHVAGKQYKVTRGDKIIIQSHFPEEVIPGTQIVLNKILLLGGKDFTVVGRPLVSANGAKVLATVEEMTRGRKVIVFKKERRKGYRRWRTHKSLLSVLNIDDVQFEVPTGEIAGERVVSVE